MTVGNPYLGFGPGSDPVAWCALAAAGITALAARSARVRARVLALSTRHVLLGFAATAALLSAGYLAYYLRGGPRIVDSTYYFLAGRALAQGDLAFSVLDPVASFRGRFLVSPADARTLSVLFPPGYPALLALGFRVGAPLLLGPLLAGALVFATHAAARALGRSETEARSAAALCVLSVALRYHTADTMSHGWSALLLTTAVACAARRATLGALVAGACMGWLCATRPASGALATSVLGVWLLARPRSAAAFGVALLPGFLLLFLHQYAATGVLGQSSQVWYYRSADGPPGCLRYGFGQGIGCWFEHADYIRARLPQGHTLVAALATTGRRLLLHTADIANFAPLALGVPLGVWFARRERAMWLLGVLVLCQIAVYVPFYFEASFPGGGARLYADVIPLELILVARSLAALRALRWAWPLALLGFALHTSGQHRALRDREGGRPMFEPDIVKRAGVTSGLLFVSTDHAFALGFDPAQRSAKDGLVVARSKDDALDGLLWQQLGRPPTYRYEFDPRSSVAEPRVVRFEPVFGSPLRIEAESLWPAASVSDGWVHPAFPPESCASRGRGLRVRGGDHVAVALALPNVTRAKTLRIAWVGRPSEASIRLAQHPESEQRIHWSANGSGEPSECWLSQDIRLSGRISGVSEQEPAPELLTLVLGEGVLDYLEWSSDPD